MEARIKEDIVELEYYTFTAKADGSIFGVLRSNTKNMDAAEGGNIKQVFYKDEPHVEDAAINYWNYKLVKDDESYKIAVEEEPSAE